MSSNSEYIKQKPFDVVINPTATNEALPTMPSTGHGGSGNSTDLDLMKFVIILFQSNACFREYCEKTKQLTLVFYNKTYTGCKVIIYLTECIITITVFQHLNILENDNYSFNPTGFQKYVMPFLTPAEVEKQKRFDDQVEEKRLMAEQREFEKQEKKSRKEALEKAHNTEPKKCGGDDICEFCKSKKAQRSVPMWKSSSFAITGT